MVKKRTKRPKLKRFTVSLEEDDYRRLRDLAEGHQPRLSLQYVVQYAVRSLLERARDPKFARQLGSPLGGGERHGKT